MRKLFVPLFFPHACYASSVLTLNTSGFKFHLKFHSSVTLAVIFLIFFSRMFLTGLCMTVKYSQITISLPILLIYVYYCHRFKKSPMKRFENIPFHRFYFFLLFFLQEKKAVMGGARRCVTSAHLQPGKSGAMIRDLFVFFPWESLWSDTHTYREKKRVDFRASMEVRRQNWQ